MNEQEYLAQYRTQQWPSPSVTVDLVIFTMIEGALQLLLIQRNEHPFKDQWALPGGFVRVGDAYETRGESLDEAAHRELSEETGLPEGSCYLEQIGAFGAPDRDPRKRIISVVYAALCNPDLVPSVVAGTDAANVRWAPVADCAGLAFDHDHIVGQALSRIRERLDHSDIAFELVPELFSIRELRTVFEAIHGGVLDRGNFRRRFKRLEDDGVLLETEHKRATATRPATLYRFNRDDAPTTPE